jgi:hypothetical protein
MPAKQNEQAAGNGGGETISAKYLNIPLSEIVRANCQKASSHLTLLRVA